MTDTTRSRTLRHTVAKGETLSSIADRYKTTVAALRRDNGKIATDLKAGSVLVVKMSD